MSRPRALENIRVVDFSWVRAGPWATRWLGALGAEIIKIEWPESERGRLPSTTTPRNVEVNLNTSGNFNDTNVNKKSLSLNVRSAKGLEVVKRLIAISDIVIENFSLARAAELGPWLRGAVQDQAGYRLCVDVGLRPHRPQSPLHHVRSRRAGGVGTDLSLRLAGQTAGWLGLVVHGRYRRHVRGDVCPHRPLPSQHDGARPAHRLVSDGIECSPQRSGTVGLHGERARVA